MPSENPYINGGSLIAHILSSHLKISTAYVLTGGHVAPLIVGAGEIEHMKIVDVRDEKHAVFAADAHARLGTDTCGVAIVTAGPGLTNTVTAIQNAKMAESPILIFGGATAQFLQGQGSLQDVDHFSFLNGVCKATFKITRVKDIEHIVHRAYSIATSATPGPVFIELPMDVIWSPKSVNEQITANSSNLGTIPSIYLKTYLWTVFRDFDSSWNTHFDEKLKSKCNIHIDNSNIHLNPRVIHSIREIANVLKSSIAPMMIIGSQVFTGAPKSISNDFIKLFQTGPLSNIPTWCSGSARGITGPSIFRHGRSTAIRGADVILLIGVAIDFRLNYGYGINSHGKKIIYYINAQDPSTNLFHRNLRNISPTRVISTKIYPFIMELGSILKNTISTNFKSSCELRDYERNQSIIALSEKPTSGKINPIKLLLKINNYISPEDIIIGDGGDFVGAMAYTVIPRKLRGWLDPGAFGTLGVGGGFGLASGIHFIERNSVVGDIPLIWVFWGDGSAAWSISEIDSISKIMKAESSPKFGLICIIGNDSAWMQMQRDQDRIFQSKIGTELSENLPYHIVGEGYGGIGKLMDNNEDFTILEESVKIAKMGRSPVIVNALIERSSFREGSISL